MVSWALGTSVASIVLASIFVLKNVGERFREAQKENPELRYMAVFKLGDLVVFGAIVVVVFVTSYLGKLVWANFNTTSSSKKQKLPSLDEEYDAPDAIDDAVAPDVSAEGFDD